MAVSNNNALQYKMQYTIKSYRLELNRLAREGRLSGDTLYQACQAFKNKHLSNNPLYQKEGRSVWADEAELNIMAALLGRSIFVKGTNNKAGVNWHANGADLASSEEAPKNDPSILCLTCYKARSSCECPSNEDDGPQSDDKTDSLGSSTINSIKLTPITIKWNGSHYFRQKPSDTRGDGKCAFHAIAAEYSAKLAPRPSLKSSVVAILDALRPGRQIAPKPAMQPVLKPELNPVLNPIPGPSLFAPRPIMQPKVVLNPELSMEHKEHQKLNELLDKGANRAAFETAFEQAAQRVSKLSPRSAHSLWKIIPTPSSPSQSRTLGKDKVNNNKGMQSMPMCVK